MPSSVKISLNHSTFATFYQKGHICCRKTPTFNQRGPTFVCVFVSVFLCVCVTAYVCVCECEKECANDRKEERLRDWETYRRTEREGKRTRENVYVCVNRRMCE